MTEDQIIDAFASLHPQRREVVLAAMGAVHRQLERMADGPLMATQSELQKAVQQYSAPVRKRNNKPEPQTAIAPTVQTGTVDQRTASHHELPETKDEGHSDGLAF
jgi:hypothetical protein